MDYRNREAVTAALAATPTDRERRALNWALTILDDCATFAVTPEPFGASVGLYGRSLAFTEEGESEAFSMLSEETAHALAAMMTAGDGGTMTERGWRYAMADGVFTVHFHDRHIHEATLTQSLRGELATALAA